MKKTWKLLRVDLLKAFRNGRIPLLSLAVCGVCILCCTEQIQTLAEYGAHGSIVDMFAISFAVGEHLLPVLYALACLAPVTGFCQQWNNGYWKPVELRSGKFSYVLGTVLSCFFQSFVIMFLGQLLFLLFLSILGAVYHLPLMTEFHVDERIVYYGWCLLPEHPALFLFWKLFVFSLSAGFWGMAAFLMAAWKTEAFTAIMIPMVLYLASDYILSRSFLHITIGTPAKLASEIEDFMDTVGYGILLYGTLSLLLGIGAGYIIKRRVEHEWHT